MKLKNTHPWVYERLQLMKMNLNHCLITTFSKKNKQLMSFKNLHEGKRCFIVATGPSLNSHDLDLISNEISFGVNSCIKAFPNTIWRPTYLCITDPLVWAKLENEVNRVKTEIDTIFFGTPEIKTNISNSIGLVRDQRPSTYIETQYYKRTKKRIGRYDFYIPKNMDRFFCDGPTVVITAIQLAIYMGFSEIYLIGTDCNFSGKRYNDMVSYEPGPIPDDVENKLFGGYQAIKRDIENRKLKVKIMNSTRGGMLETFERIELENILKGG